MKEQEATKTHSGEHSRGPGSGPAKKRHPVLAFTAFVAVALCALILYRTLSGTKAKPRPSNGIPVSTGVAKVGDIDIFLDALGTVTPVYTVTVTSRVAGQVTQVLYKEGQLVKKGDVLAIIDPRPYKALVDQAQGQLARDQALLRNAKLDLVRYQNAFEQHAIPQQQLATQQALVDQYAGTVQLDQGSLDAAAVNLDYSTITSPIDGRVGLRSIDPGNIVAADGTAALATITQIDPITVIFTISEDDLTQVIAQISAGRTLVVDALDRAQQNRIARGTLLTVDNQINTATGTVRARALFDNKKDELFPNQFVNARLLVRTLKNVILVPAASIQRNSDETFVYVVQPGGTVVSRDVKVQATEAENTAVTGVKSGEELVTDGFDKLQSGTKVAVRAKNDGEAAAAQAVGHPETPTGHE